MKKCNFLLVVISVLFISCGGDDESFSIPTPVVTSVPAPTVTSVPVPEVNPEISITYPNSKSIIAAGEVIHARGSFSGGTSSNLQISLNAGAETVNAVLNDTDNTWSVAELPTEYGALGVEISATITNVTTDVSLSDTVSLESKAIANAIGLFFDETNSRLIYSDSSQNVIAELDLDTNESSIISSNDIGFGEYFTEVGHLDVNLNANKAYVINYGERVGTTIIEVDLSSGDKRILFDANDELYQRFKGLVYSSLNNILYITDQIDSTIFSINVTTGDRVDIGTLILDGETNTYCDPEMITSNSDDTVLYFICGGLSEYIMSMNVITGETTVISGEFEKGGVDSNVGTGIEFIRINDIRYNESNHTLSVTETTNDGIFTVDIATGNRDFVMPLKNETGDRLFFPAGLQFGTVPGEYFITDDIAGIIQVTGDSWELLDGSNVGFGRSVSRPMDFFFSSKDNTFYTVDSIEEKIFSINPLSGDRVLFGSTLLNGEDRDDIFIVSSIFDEVSNRILMSDNRNGGVIYSYDLETKIRTTLSENGTSIGRDFSSIGFFAIDFVFNKLWLPSSSRDELVGVNLFTGDREVFFEGITSDIEIEVVGAMTIHDRNFIVFDSLNNTIFNFNRFSGEISTILDDVEALKFESPVRIITDSKNSRYLVTDIAKKELFAVSYSSSRIVTSISNNYDHKGIKFMSPMGMYLDEENNRVLVSDIALNGIIAVDLTTGNRTLFSR